MQLKKYEGVWKVECFPKRTSQYVVNLPIFREKIVLKMKGVNFIKIVKPFTVKDFERKLDA